MPSLKSDAKRSTRIDKDVKTRAQQSKILAFLYDFMWSYRYYPFLAVSLLFLEAILGYLIIQRVSYTEIDWKAYMQQVAMFKAGERDYSNIRGSTGPLVYPAGFLYIFSLLHSLTENGENIYRAQLIFLGFYLSTMAAVMATYYRARVLPPWGLILLCLSKRLHSIYLLRLFNDGVAMMLLYIAIYQFVRQRWRIGCCLFSCAVSVKMNCLLFAPALFFLLLQSCGYVRTLRYITMCGIIQVALALPFLRHNAYSYLSKAFEFDRVFMYKWTVNWKFLPEDVFLSKYLAVGLLGGHILFLLLFIDKHFNILGTFKAVMHRPWKLYEPFPIQSEVIVTTLFISNYIGICFARTMHYQFYAWYYLSLPYLVWKANIPLIFKVKVLLMTEYAFNTFPATSTSSMVLQMVNVFTLLSLYSSDDSIRYLAYLDADARLNLINYINEECFDGARQLALYYGSVTEDLALGARVISIDEREVVLSLPQLHLTLAIGFGDSAPIPTESYGRHVLNGMLREAADGISAGDTLGKLVSRQWLEKEQNQTSDPAASSSSQSSNLRHRSVQP